MGTDQDEIEELFDHAEEDEVITPSSASVLTDNLGDVVIDGADGKDVEEIMTTSVTLVTVMLDKSDSIGFRGLEEAVCDGYELLLEGMQNSKESDSIMASLWSFNNTSEVVHSYLPVDEAEGEFNRSAYRPSGGTALYDVWCEGLSSNIAYAQQLQNGGTPVRSIAVVITDGEDTASSNRPSDCEKVTKDVLASEQFVTGFVGVGDDYDYETIARKMGIPDGSILVDDQADASSIRDVFGMVSESVSKVSQGSIQPGPNTGFFE